MNIMTFYPWLISQVERNDAIGDLAQKVKNDRYFPKRADVNEMLLYLKSRFSCLGVLRVMKTAHKEYKKNRKKQQAELGLIKRS